MTTTALALRESLAQESGVGTLSIIHNLHLVYIQNLKKKKKSILYTTTQLTFRFHWSEEKKKKQVVLNSVLVQEMEKKKKEEEEMEQDLSFEYSPTPS